MILYAEVECFLYEGNSLKDKRSIMKRLFAKISQDYNVAIAELDYQDLWQRTKFGIVTISTDSVLSEKVIQQVLEVIDSSPELERTITTVDPI
jgi:hypothetical protein